MKFKNWKHWKTTLLGVVIIIAAIVSVFINTNWADAIIGIAAGLMLVFAPDTILDKIKTLIKFVVLAFVLQSCSSTNQLAKKCASKFPIKDSTIVIEKIDTTYITVKGDTVKVPVKSGDSIVYVKAVCPPKKVATVTKYKEKVVYQENTAKVKSLENVILDLNKELAKTQEKLESKEKELSRVIKLALSLLFILIVIGLYRLLAWKFRI